MECKNESSTIIHVSITYKLNLRYVNNNVFKKSFEVPIQVERA